MGSKNDLATLLNEAAHSGDSAVLARVVDLRGFGGSTRVGQGAVIFADRWFGGFFGDSPHDVVVAQARKILAGDRSSGCVELVVGDEEAVAARLACGGTATVVLARLDELQGDLDAVLVRRTPYAVVTLVAKKDQSVEFHGLFDLDDGAPSELVSLLQSEAIERDLDLQVRKGRAELFRLEDDRFVLYGEIVTPDSRVVIVGSGELAEAIVELGSGLEMEAEIVTAEVRAIELVKELGPRDGLIVLSHDHDLATPVLVELLERSPRTYVGSLGSRHTQQERRRRLEAAGLSHDALRSFYGPAGLDLGSRTVRETAVAIVAELLAHRSGRSGGHLRDSNGPING